MSCLRRENWRGISEMKNGITRPSKCFFIGFLDIVSFLSIFPKLSAFLWRPEMTDMLVVVGVGHYERFLQIQNSEELKHIGRRRRDEH